MPKQRYEEVADDLRGKIKNGEYPPGSRLPSRAELMREYQCSDTVIGKAMMLLRAEGLTETQAGVAVYVKKH
ncbi:winged helix-turn-helix domain-containing protein [Planosporangium sp. 12N6]|uniref:winged helix-turn-helix domain-containing protein n=1 Tax=Planosporangium spinosum TaxID=3402278 RepID=UPI003CED2F29